tara:strand:+ start:140 stop:382 length:243 start_codon:yes stop_codon:yes gene_type:complete
MPKLVRKRVAVQYLHYERGNCITSKTFNQMRKERINTGKKRMTNAALKISKDTHAFRRKLINSDRNTVWVKINMRLAGVS